MQSLRGSEKLFRGCMAGLWKRCDWLPAGAATSQVANALLDVLAAGWWGLRVGTRAPQDQKGRRTDGSSREERADEPHALFLGGQAAGVATDILCVALAARLAAAWATRCSPRRRSCPPNEAGWRRPTTRSRRIGATGRAFGGPTVGRRLI